MHERDYTARGIWIHQEIYSDSLPAEHELTSSCNSVVMALDLSHPLGRDGRSVVGVSGCGLHGGQDSARFDFGVWVGPVLWFQRHLHHLCHVFLQLMAFLYCFRARRPLVHWFPSVRWLFLSLPSFPSGSSPVSPPVRWSSFVFAPSILAHIYIHPCQPRKLDASRTRSFSHQYCRRQFLNHPSHGRIYHYPVALFLMFHHHHLDSRRLSPLSHSYSISPCFLALRFQGCSELPTRPTTSTSSSSLIFLSAMLRSITTL